jgi:hypothetical protein
MAESWSYAGKVLRSVRGDLAVVASKRSRVCGIISDPDWLSNLAFLVDMTKHFKI